MEHDLNFRLPPNITVTKQTMLTGIGYIFRDIELGEIGRLAVEETSTGEAQITCEVVGDRGDPMTMRRFEIFEPLAKELTSAFEKRTGKGRKAPLPDRKSQPAGQIACKEVPCAVCGKMVAFLIFADKATDRGRFEDYARLMYEHYTRHNVPAYIIGPELGDGPMNYRADILKVWPQRGQIEQLRPDEFNPRINELITQHCITGDAASKVI